jgi:Holliday junction resolvasome RuvABC endonuclease subunit
MVIMGVDPGSNYCGVAIFDIDDYTLKIKNVQPFTINLTVGDKSHYENTVLERLSNLFKYIYDITIDYNVYWLAIEAGYMSRLQPTAFGPLSKTIITIENGFIKGSGSYNITEFSPSIMKSVLNTDSNHKDDMYKAVKKVKELSRYVDVNIREHAVDAMAIGYTKLLDIRSNPECILYTIR